MPPSEFIAKKRFIPGKFWFIIQVLTPKSGTPPFAVILVILHTGGVYTTAMGEGNKVGIRPRKE